MEEVYGRDWNEWYQHIKCPVLFMPCEQEQEVLPNSEHLMTYDQSDEVVAEVFKFFEKIR